MSGLTGTAPCFPSRHDFAPLAGIALSGVVAALAWLLAGLSVRVFGHAPLEPLVLAILLARRYARHGRQARIGCPAFMPVPGPCWKSP